MMVQLDLRLTGAALVTWAATFTVLWWRSPWCGIAAALLGGLCLCWWGWQQGVLGSVCAGCSVALCWLRILYTPRVLPNRLLVRVIEQPRETVRGMIVQAEVEDLRQRIPIYMSSKEKFSPGDQLWVSGSLVDTDKAAVFPHLFVAEDVERVGRQLGLIWKFKESYSFHVASVLPENAAGIIPGLVLGDTSLQGSAERQAYLDTGLSHLSAVSGGNVAIVVGVVGMLCARFGPRVRVGCCLSALLAYVVLVGVEPSVVRAGISGGIAVLAVLVASQVSAIHSLSLAVIVSLWWQSDFATSLGFGLSVTATAGIILLSPLILKALYVVRAPTWILQALALTLAAEIVTLPLLIAVTGRISLVGVIANVMVAPAVVPLTVLGLLAFLLCIAGLGAVSTLVLWICWPFAAWISSVARVGAAIPGVVIEVQPSLLLAAWVVLGVCWMAWGRCARRLRWVLSIGAGIAVLWVSGIPWAIG